MAVVLVNEDESGFIGPFVVSLRVGAEVDRLCRTRRQVEYGGDGSRGIYIGLTVYMADD